MMNTPCVDDDFWRRQAELLHWHTPFQRVVEWVDNGPRCRWFPGGITNLCHNALDRHLPEKADKTALIHCDYAGHERRVSYGELWREAQAMAWLLQQQGVGAGDRVLLCLPTTPQTVALMLACARLGAVHVVVYSLTAVEPLAQRIAASQPRVVIHTSERRGRDALPSLADACRRAGFQPPVVLDAASAAFASQHQRGLAQRVPCRWLPADAPSHILYTSGTTGTPKGVVRDGAGYGVALLATFRHLFQIQDDDVFFTSADVGWVTGHSYGVYAPLLAGITSVLVEASPLNKPGGRWWRLVERFGITRMLTIPGAMRLARQQGNIAADVRGLRAIYLAGEPLDAPTRQWVSATAGVPVEDHYWQTESGWPLLAGAHGALRPVTPRRLDVLDDDSGASCPPGRPGMLVVRDTLGPSGMQTLWRDDVEHDQRYWRWDGARWSYFTHDRAVRRADGAITVLGRMDDVINVGGKRLSTVEVERTVQDLAGVAEAVAVGVPHPLLGQMVGLYVVTPLTDPAARQRLQRDIRQRVIDGCGRHALPRRILFVTQLPRTFSGKVVRRGLGG